LDNELDFRTQKPAGRTKIGVAGQAAVITEPPVIDPVVALIPGMKEASCTRLLQTDQPDIRAVVKIGIFQDVRFPQFGFSTEFENGFHGPLNPHKGFGSIFKKLLQDMLGCIYSVVKAAACTT